MNATRDNECQPLSPSARESFDLYRELLEDDHMVLDDVRGHDPHYGEWQRLTLANPDGDQEERTYYYP